MKIHITLNIPDPIAHALQDDPSSDLFLSAQDSLLEIITNQTNDGQIQELVQDAINDQYKMLSLLLILTNEQLNFLINDLDISSTDYIECFDPNNQQNIDPNHARDILNQIEQQL